MKLFWLRPTATGRCRNQGPHQWVFKRIAWGTLGEKSAFEFPILEMFPPELLVLAPADHLAGATPSELQATTRLSIEVLAELSRPKQ